jgi:hypothetical protein
MTTHLVPLIGGADSETAELIESEGTDTCSLACNYRGKSIEAHAADFFEALVELRKELEKEGLLLLCYGASLNVYPSRMSREMAAGRAAYKATLGKQARREHLVQIFEQGPDIIPTSVQRQREFFEAWLKSLP